MTELEKKIQNAVDEQQKNHEPLRLESQPIEFPTHTQGYITNTIEIARRISEALNVFRDYAGCRPYCFMGQPFPTEIARTMILGNLYVDLYFEKDAGEPTGFENLKLVGESDGAEASPLDRVRSVCGGINNATTYKVNKDTLEMLSEFLPTYNPQGNSGNPLWNVRIIEELSTAGTYLGNRNKISVRVIGLSVDNFMNLIYGTNDPDDQKTDKSGRPFIRYDYHCIPIANSMARINAYGNAQPTGALDQEYVVQVLRNDRSIISAMQKSIGITNMAGGGNYVPRNQV